MIKPQTNPYEFFCRRCKTGLKLPQKLSFEFLNGDENCVITRPNGVIICPNCGSVYKLKKIWRYGEAKIEVYKDGFLTPEYTKIYRKAKVK